MFRVTRKTTALAATQAVRVVQVILQENMTESHASVMAKGIMDIYQGCSFKLLSLLLIELTSTYLSTI